MERARTCAASPHLHFLSLVQRLLPGEQGPGWRPFGLAPCCPASWAGGGRPCYLELAPAGALNAFSPRCSLLRSAGCAQDLLYSCPGHALNTLHATPLTQPEGLTRPSPALTPRPGPWDLLFLIGYLTLIPGKTPGSRLPGGLYIARTPAALDSAEPPAGQLSSRILSGYPALLFWEPSSPASSSSPGARRPSYGRELPGRPAPGL